ncbi:MAG: ribulose-phosphate 3-epimerase [Candidatus Hermodarchaeota archaeon]
MKKIAVSIHAKDNFNPDILKNLKEIDFIHIDVMDGKFVDSLNLNLDIFKIVKENFEIPILAHLMVIDPLNYVNVIINYVYAFLFHFEIETDIISVIEAVKKYKKKVGLVLNPSTNISDILEYLSLLDIILVLGVNPGWSGQKFIPKTINKIEELANYKTNYNFLIDVDGGINLETARSLINADILTSASAILNAKEPNAIIQKLKTI